jgi:putative transposase
MSAKLSTGRVRQAYKFIDAHRKRYNVEAMCRTLEVAPSGYYDWLKQPLSNRALEGSGASGDSEVHRRPRTRPVAI